MIKANGAQVRCDLCGFEWFQVPTLYSLGAYIQTPPALHRPQGIHILNHLCSECAIGLNLKVPILLKAIQIESTKAHLDLHSIEKEKATIFQGDKEVGPTITKESLKQYRDNMREVPGLGAKISSSSPEQPHSEVSSSTSASER